MSDTDIRTDDGELDGAASRRQLLSRGAVAAAAAAVVGLASSQRAHAANGDTVHVGQTTSGGATTKLSGGTTLWVENGKSQGNSSLYGTTKVTAGHGVRGASSGTQGIGVLGESSGTSGVGVYGIHQGDTVSGSGVHGWSKFGPGVIGRGTTFDLLANGSGRIGILQVGTTGATANGTAGTIAKDSAGNLWYCYAPNKWQRIGGPGIAGGFHAISPVRVFDSRIASVPGSGQFQANTSRVISVKDGRDVITGVVNAANAVPSGATAIAYNLTVADTVGAGWLFIAPSTATAVSSSSINWSSTGSLLANAGAVKLGGDRQVKIFCGPAPTHAIVDITGYYI